MCFQRGMNVSLGEFLQQFPRQQINTPNSLHLLSYTLRHAQTLFFTGACCTCYNASRTHHPLSFEL